MTSSDNRQGNPAQSDTKRHLEYPETVTITYLYISSGHNFKGHHGRTPGTNPVRSVSRVECVAGRGIAGDRFFDHKDNFKGQVTFFSQAVFEALCRALNLENASLEALRRNVIVHGIELQSLIGKKFSLGDVVFEGTQSCEPCYWMDHALGPGAEGFLKGQGGLRARILNGGYLYKGEAKLRLMGPAT